MRGVRKRVVGRHYKHLRHIHKVTKVDPWQCLPVLEHAELNYLSFIPIGCLTSFIEIHWKSAPALPVSTFSYLPCWNHARLPFDYLLVNLASL